MIPYAVDELDPPLAFVPSWISALAEKVERLHVVTPAEGAHPPFPSNVTVYNLQKNQGASKLKRLARLYETLWHILRTEGLDVCFVHMHTAMTPICWPLLQLHNVPIVSWYAHGHVDKTIPLTHLLSASIVSSCKAAYVYRQDAKVRYIGQGINETVFVPKGIAKDWDILSVGRISPVKGLETLLRAVAELRDRGRNLSCRLVGNAPAEHAAYLEHLKTLAQELKIADLVHFLPPMRNSETPAAYNRAWLHVNCAPSDNSMDKAILEAAFCGIPSLTSADILHETYGPLSPSLIFTANDHVDLANKIAAIPPEGTSAYAELAEKLRSSVQQHSLSAFMDRLKNVLSQAAGCARPANRR